jgi:hypothetical protein
LNFRRHYQATPSSILEFDFDGNEDEHLLRYLKSKLHTGYGFHYASIEGDADWESNVEKLSFATDEDKWKTGRNSQKVRDAFRVKIKASKRIVM